MIIKNLIKKFFFILNYKIISSEKYKELVSAEKERNAYELVNLLKPSLKKIIINNISFSKSQNAQDLFVLSELNFKKKGFFVEFGATDGIDLSNTYLLEKKFSWKGILAEPARQFHKHLEENRNVFIEKNCVWHSSNKNLIFNEIGGLSTIDSFSDFDINSKGRSGGKKYKVQTISLEDLLDKYNAPSKIDYLSIDTEGSELEILSSFNFEKYKFQIITVEHNYNSNREQIYKLLLQKGYIRKYTDISKVDDWYVLRENL